MVVHDTVRSSAIDLTANQKLLTCPNEQLEHTSNEHFNDLSVVLYNKAGCKCELTIMAMGRNNESYRCHYSCPSKFHSYRENRAEHNKNNLNIMIQNKMSPHK